MKKFVIAITTISLLFGAGAALARFDKARPLMKAKRHHFVNACQARGHEKKQCVKKLKRFRKFAKRKIVHVCQANGISKKLCLAKARKIKKRIGRLNRHRKGLFIKGIFIARKACLEKLGKPTNRAERRALRKCIGKTLGKMILERRAKFREYREICLDQLGEKVTREELRACVLEKHKIANEESTKKEDTAAEEGNEGNTSGGSSSEPAEDEGVANDDVPATGTDAANNYGQI